MHTSVGKSGPLSFGELSTNKTTTTSTSTVTPLIINRYNKGVFSLSWKPNGDSLDFSFTTNLYNNTASNVWAAFGFSKNNHMVNLLNNWQS